MADSMESVDSLSRSESNVSLQSNATSKSRRSSIDMLYDRTRKRRGVLNKIGTSFQNVFRRVFTAHKPLTDLEIQILSSVTHFSREEILKWHEKFLADCPHGYMTRKEFLVMYKTLNPKGDVDRFARHIFRAFDLDRSNTVDFREFLIGLSMTSTVSSTRTKLQWIFQVFDIDGNGLLTRSECLEVMDTIVRFGLSQRNATDDDECSDSEEYVRSAKRKMMRIFDNRSEMSRHALTMNQFVEGCEQDEFISELLAPTNSSTI